MEKENKEMITSILAGLAHNQEIINKKLDDIEDALGLIMETLVDMIDSDDGNQVEVKSENE